jgi:hypothetical protein
MIVRARQRQDAFQCDMFWLEPHIHWTLSFLAQVGPSTQVSIFEFRSASTPMAARAAMICLGEVARSLNTGLERNDWDAHWDL